jgi:hypothetical protein
VIAVESDGELLTIFSDLTMKEFKAMASDVAVAADVATGRYDDYHYNINVVVVVVVVIVVIV